MNKLKLVGVCVALSLVFCASAEAKLYKWVDDNGTTHYGETIPPEYANKDTTELNDKGYVEKRVEKLTPEAKRAKDADAAKKKTEQQASIEATRKDNALLSTFSNEKEIDLARDRSVQQVEARIGSFNTMLTGARESLASHHQEQDTLLKQNKKIPASLKDDIEENESRIAKLQQDLDQSENELASVKARFEADKLRYRELKNGAAKSVTK